MNKIKWDNHVNVKCDFILGSEVSKATCTALCNEEKNILELNNVFDLGKIKATLTEVRYNTENTNVYYVFEKKGGF